MKIGIITYWSSDDNYGQILQCYALQRYLISQGHKAYLIRYLPNNKGMSFLQKIKRNLSFERIMYLFSKERKINKIRHSAENKLKEINMHLNTHRRFTEFKEAHIFSTPIVYHSLDELRKNPPDADVYICGSDQVWNNSLLKKETAAWFLSFGSKDTKRISYAASIGRSIESNEQKILKNLLKDFNAISVREESARNLCEGLGFPDTCVTLDPTLLLPTKEYQKLEPATYDKVKPYMFMYVLNVYTSKDIYWDKFNDYIKAHDIDLKIVYSSGYIQARKLIETHKNIYPTIPQWLQLIDKSECVVTTSFHGVVFCIKMHKPFLVIMLNNLYSKGNDRITSLLKALNMSERIYNPQASVEEQMKADIDWDCVDQAISSLQELSFNFLLENLK